MPIDNVPIDRTGAACPRIVAWCPQRRGRRARRGGRARAPLSARRAPALPVVPGKMRYSAWTGATRIAVSSPRPPSVGPCARPKGDHRARAAHSVRDRRPPSPEGRRRRARRLAKRARCSRLRGRPGASGRQTRRRAQLHRRRHPRRPDGTPNCRPYRSSARRSRGPPRFCADVAAPLRRRAAPAGDSPSPGTARSRSCHRSNPSIKCVVGWSLKS